MSSFPTFLKHFAFKRETKVRVQTFAILFYHHFTGDVRQFAYPTTVFSWLSLTGIMPDHISRWMLHTQTIAIIVRAIRRT